MAEYNQDFALSMLDIPLPPSGIVNPLSRTVDYLPDNMGYLSDIPLPSSDIVLPLPDTPLPSSDIVPPLPDIPSDIPLPLSDTPLPSSDIPLPPSNTCLWLRDEAHVCAESFRETTELHEHVVKSHTANYEKQPGGFWCLWSGCSRAKNFETKSKLTRHMQSHTGCKFDPTHPNVSWVYMLIKVQSNHTHAVRVAKDCHAGRH